MFGIPWANDIVNLALVILFLICLTPVRIGLGRIMKIIRSSNNSKGDE